MFRPSIQPRSLSPWRKPARRGAAEETDWGDSNPIRLTGPVGWAIPVRGPKMAPPPSSAMTSRRLVRRERSIVRGDGGPFTPPPPSRLEARSRLSQHSCSFLYRPSVPCVEAKPRLREAVGHRTLLSRRERTSLSHQRLRRTKLVMAQATPEPL